MAEKRSQLTESDFRRRWIYSDYLLNKSPYGIKGGVYDILNASNGETYVVPRDDAIRLQNCEEVEGIDIMFLHSCSWFVDSSKGFRIIHPDDCIANHEWGG